MTERDELVRSLSGLSLFSDLRDADLEAIADPDLERRFVEGERVLRRGLSGSGFYVILDGEAAVEIAGDDEPRKLRRGDFFGEVSTLLDCKPTADVIARTQLHALEIPGPQLETFLLQYPRVTYRMLQTVTRRLRDVLG
ncbi:MAG TPA: cyclic nucleotide-binding domain-containing protein [Gaiellaceae bacterium]|jgi:CRP-like cAMP-binding protein|nr:cyclic nucleotide-binding domain-containing protein [Gaiellaceae bacterium]